MTDDERGLLAAVLADPADDHPRKVYADWLEEQPVEYRDCPDCENESGYRVYCKTCEHSGRAGRVSDGRAERAAYIRASIRCYHDDTENGWVLQPHVHCKTWDARIPGLRDEQYLYRRGFVERVELRLAEYMTHAADLFSRHPLGSVRLTDIHPFRTAGGLWEYPVSDNPTRTASIPWDVYDLFAECRLRTAEHAAAVLSPALVAHGRQLVGLSPIAAG